MQLDPFPRSLDGRLRPPAGRARDGELERIVAEAHAHVDAGSVVERGEQVLDDPVRGQLDAGRQNARDCPRRSAARRRPSRAPAAPRGGSGSAAAPWGARSRRRAVHPTTARISSSVRRLWLSISTRVAVAVAGSRRAGAASAIPASSPRRRWRSSSSSPERRARSVATSSRARSSRASRSSRCAPRARRSYCRRERTTRPMPQIAVASGHEDDGEPAVGGLRPSATINASPSPSPISASRRSSRAPAVKTSRNAVGGTSRQRTTSEPRSSSSATTPASMAPRAAIGALPTPQEQARS